jgi:toxin ParE1/3/4
MGAEFVEALDAAITVIVDFPEAHPVIHRDSRRYLLDRFPYGIYYRVEGRGVVVVACLHAARDPRRARRRAGA